ncbi:MAG: ADP-ribosylglycohydrolase family protein [Anaerolineae bacterium]|nr:MAG: ADP-ribosylglycohydrolase family protein [Anaerolineae bacterium]MCL4877813.1 ADP-ribosylglycohydrolase family protein [Anaerolineae bacterium]
MTDAALQRTLTSLEGLSIADSLGGFFEGFGASSIHFYIHSRQLPNPPWHFTDDTNMALSVVSILRQCGEIHQDKLARSFGEHFDSTRGYGLGARALLSRIQLGAYWRSLASEMFGGAGSYGNGGAMRVAPIGAFFANDLGAVVKNARLSAEITHSHLEGIAGAVAVAVAAAIAVQSREKGYSPPHRAFLEQVIVHVPEGKVRQGILKAIEIGEKVEVKSAAEILGNGSFISAQDTVPFALWNAARHLDNYEEAIWTTLSAGGDADTTAAIVGGIVVLYAGLDSIPQAWRERREPLPAWYLEETTPE